MSLEISEAVRQFILAHAVARLATCGQDGQPHVIPFCYAFDGRHFYFVVDEKPKRQTGQPLKRIRNMLENPQVALVIDDYLDDWTRLAYVLVQGTAALVEAEAEYATALALLRERYPQYRSMALAFARNAMVRITPTKVHAWGRIEAENLGRNCPMSEQDHVPQSTSARRTVYGGYEGKPDPSERDKLMHLLDQYGCTEGFVAEYLPRWIEVSPNEAVKGGLRTIQLREASHARLMKARLLELGGVRQYEIPPERRERELPFFSSPERTDAEKLQALATLFGDAEEFLKPVTDLIAEIKEDQQSKELLRTIIDDERASIKWLVEMSKSMS